MAAIKKVTWRHCRSPKAKAKAVMNPKVDGFVMGFGLVEVCGAKWIKFLGLVLVLMGY